MKGYEAAQQIDIFNLDILEPLKIKDKKKVALTRKEKEMKRLYHTLKISNILDNKCGSCEFNNTQLSNCESCPFFKELRYNAKGIEETTSDKIHKESWEQNRNEKKDDKRERLYTFELLRELEEIYMPEEIFIELETMSMADLAREIDCEYNVLKSFVNKYRKMKP